MKKIPTGIRGTFTQGMAATTLESLPWILTSGNSKWKIFFRKAKCSPVEIVLEYVSDRERGISSKTEEKYDEACSWDKDVWMHQLDVWLDRYNN